MIKQELIGILEGLEGDSFIEKYNEGYDQAVRDCLIAVKQLDEPKKTVLPKKADDFIKEGEGIGSDKVDIIDSAISFARAMPNDEFSLWFKSNRDLFVDAVSNGYKVKKEQLYKVVIDHKYLVQLFSGRTDARLVEYEELTNWHDSAYKLTESVIKSIDERYWPFAVKVEEA
ncbi:TPA: DUF1642 domain-containing protein [Enterococcus faecalis]|uniref:DUF1642 domain-containing protein n=1 Tax=Enterococcus faecalis TaxID=1351 RepID=A0ABD7XBE5_ENTFL|nr:DUF1642 domain-containing protein [Enterococcus faecalis]WEH21834.1 DUF1642 domain-containing protein [Enterococcus faecalis]HAP5284345.1 DUF1642 domain-containing protein [Enterococcus faecalis]HAP5321104.1 DUF1642 domain-containing protein [Enterococcus faecalis]HAP5690372.1 DUF1642 domain-containing protein [Enterococcus faecalis]HCR3795832.1 DUF1642 domain-containing protein [Enterococcus faecalis]